MTRSSSLLCCALLLAACGSGDDDGGGLPGEATVFAVSTDYVSTGVASTVAIPSLEVTQNAIAGVASTDPTVRYIDGTLYVINRFGADNITIIDPETTMLVAQISTGAGTNPHDLAVVGTRLYVAAFGSGDVLVIDAARPSEGVIATIDLSAMDPDGVPNCTAITSVGDYVYVVCGVLDDEDGFFTPRGPGRLAVIDPSDDSLVTDIALAGTNPQGRLTVAPPESSISGELLIDAVPNYGDLTEGCIERIIPGAEPEPNGCLVQHATLGGYAGSMAWSGADLWLAVTTGWDQEDFQPLGMVIPFDTADMTLAATPMTPSSQRPFDVVRCPTGHLVVADAAGGLRVYDSAGVEQTTEPLDIGLPPIAGGQVCY